MRRLTLEHIVARPWFDAIVLAAIAANTVTLVADNPLDDPQSQKQRVLQKLDWVRACVGGFGGCELSFASSQA